VLHFIIELATVKFDWEQIISTKFTFADHLKKLASFFQSPDKKKTNSDELLKRYFQVIVENQDHGTFSAIKLIDQLIQQLREFDGALVTKREAEMYLAALAISLHNPCIFDTLKVGGEPTLKFEAFPIEFILVFCDVVQEWGRRKKYQKAYDSPEFEALKVTQNNVGQLVIESSLKYNNINHPSPDIIQSYSSKVRVRFVSKHNFVIRYKFTDADDEVVRFGIY